MDNSQSYLDRIEYLQNGGDPGEGPRKRCLLCFVFIKPGYCQRCPLGPKYMQCMDDDSFLRIWWRATIPELKTRMEFLLKRYKKAGLEIEIAEAGK